MKTHLTLLMVVGLATSLAAQQNIVYTETTATGGLGSAFPFGSAGVRQQQLIPQAVIGPNPAVIQDLYFSARLDTGGIYNESEVYYDDIEIRMGLVPIASLTANWATNLPSPSYVYRGPLRVKFVRDQWMPVGLPAPFTYAPTSPNENLVIDFIVWSVADTGSVPPSPFNNYFLFVYTATARDISRAAQANWIAGQSGTAQHVDSYGVKMGFLLNDGNFVAHDGGCQTSAGTPARIGSPAGTWPQLGQPFTTELHGVPPGVPAFSGFGLTDRMAGPLLLPFDLGPVGAPGCFLWHDAIATAGPVVADPSGYASITLPIPSSSSLFGLRLYNSWFALDPPTNPAGLVTSGYATIIIGS